MGAAVNIWRIGVFLNSPQGLRLIFTPTTFLTVRKGRGPGGGGGVVLRMWIGKEWVWGGGGRRVFSWTVRIRGDTHDERDSAQGVGTHPQKG